MTSQMTRTRQGCRALTRARKRLAIFVRDLDQFNAVMRAVPEDFLVYSGNDSDTHTIMSLGGYGIISVAAHLVALFGNEAGIRRCLDRIAELGESRLEFGVRSGKVEHTRHLRAGFARGAGVRQVGVPEGELPPDGARAELRGLPEPGLPAAPAAAPAASSGSNRGRSRGRDRASASVSSSPTRRSAASSTSIRRSVSSSAALRPTFGSAPAPSPRTPSPGPFGVGMAQVAMLEYRASVAGNFPVASRTSLRRRHP